MKRKVVFQQPILGFIFKTCCFSFAADQKLGSFPFSWLLLAHRPQEKEELNHPATTRAASFFFFLTFFMAKEAHNKKGEKDKERKAPPKGCESEGIV